MGPKGQTPILQYNFNWDLLSVIAGMTWWNFYFQFCKGSIRGPQVVEFLRHLMRHIHGPIILIWDRLPAHKSRMVQDFIAAQDGRIHPEYVPAYAPDLNPVEYLWGYWKQHQLPNICPLNWWELSERARITLRRMRRRPRLITAFWKQAELSF